MSFSVYISGFLAPRILLETFTADVPVRLKKLCLLLTANMGQITWEANDCSGGEDYLPLSWIRNIRYRAHKRVPNVPVLKDLYRIYAFVR